MNLRTAKLAALVAAMTLASSASADLIYDVASTHGTAHFDWTSANTLTLTLTDVFVPTNEIAKELDGFEFTLDATGTLTTINSVTAVSVIDCTGSTVSSCPAAVGPFPANFGWDLTNSGGGAFSIDASSLGSHHAYAIVNSSYDGSNDGVPNPQHNPLLIGPVVFSLTFTGFTTAPGIVSSVFEFGTVPALETGASSSSGSNDTSSSGSHDVPEPSSSALALLGVLLLGGTMLWRRRSAQS